ncbi:hypothetical protein ACFY30_30715 [Streptomyces sp. NPDC000345]|uniref:hypothetical protein n=1 Tax=Streptomyces sp. NPDC000345 TaxID=3364537 RepID=UPI003690A324
MTAEAPLSEYDNRPRGLAPADLLWASGVVTERDGPLVRVRYGPTEPSSTSR